MHFQTWSVSDTEYVELVIRENPFACLRLNPETDMLVLSERDKGEGRSPSLFPEAIKPSKMTKRASVNALFEPTNLRTETFVGRRATAYPGAFREFE